MMTKKSKSQEANSDDIKVSASAPGPKPKNLAATTGPKPSSLSITNKAKDRDGTYTLVPGDHYSLNMKARQFYAVPGFELTTASPTAQIPENLSVQSKNMIKGAVRAGHIIKGGISIPFITKNKGKLSDFLEILDSAVNARRDLWPIICKVSKSHKTDLGNYSNREVINAMIIHEIKKDVPRKAHLELLQYAMDKMPGHTLVTEDIAEPKMQRDMIQELKDLHHTSPPHPSSKTSEI